MNTNELQNEVDTCEMRELTVEEFASFGGGSGRIGSSPGPSPDTTRTGGLTY